MKKKFEENVLDLKKVFTRFVETILDLKKVSTKFKETVLDPEKYPQSLWKLIGR